MDQVIQSIPKRVQKRKGADREHNQLGQANASTVDKNTTQPSNRRGAEAVSKHIEERDRGSDDDSSGEEGPEEAIEVREDEIQNTNTIGSSTQGENQQDKPTKAPKKKWKKMKGTSGGELVSREGDLSQDKHDKQHRKRWTPTEVNLLLLACVFHRHVYKEDPVDGLVRIQKFISPIIEASMESIRIKIKNMKSAKRKHTLDQKEYDLFNAFIHAVDEESLPTYYGTELQDKLLALRVNFNAQALLAKRVGVGQTDGGQQENDWQSMQIAHVLEPTAHRDDPTCGRIKQPLGANHTAPPTDTIPVNLAHQLLLRLDQQSAKIACMAEMLERLAGQVERLSEANK